MRNTTRSILLAALIGLTPGLATAGVVLICVTKPVPFKLSKAQRAPGAGGAYGQLMSAKWLTGSFAHRVNDGTYHCSDGRTAHLSGLLMSGGFRLMSVRPSLRSKRVYKKTAAKARSVPKGELTPFTVRMEWQVVATLVAGG